MPITGDVHIIDGVSWIDSDRDARLGSVIPWLYDISMDKANSKHAKDNRYCLVLSFSFVLTAHDDGLRDQTQSIRVIIQVYNLSPSHDNYMTGPLNPYRPSSRTIPSSSSSVPVLSARADP